MSTRDSTTSINNVTSSPFTNLIFRSGWPIVWPEKMSFSAWQKLSKAVSAAHKINENKNSCRKQKRRKKHSSSYRKFLRVKGKLRGSESEPTATKTIKQLEALQCVEQPQVEPTDGVAELELVTVLKHFWERRHMSELVEKTIPDRRNKELVTYTKQSIMMAVLSIFLFRMGSGNKYDDKSHDKDEKYSKANIARFIDAPEERAPVIKTIETFLKNLEEQSINDLMIAFFKDLQVSKFFRQHPQIMPGDFFLLAADCVHTHTYDKPHHADASGNNDCPCCLKRVYNKGCENEKVKWMHNTLVFSFVFLGGLKIPIYSYPIHAKQIVDFESVSEDKHKQECELVALKVALPAIREAFPRMKLVLLLDGLYANKPVIKLTAEQRCGYIIVRKDACLSTLARECDEQAATLNHKKNCVRRCQKIYEGWMIDQKYEWFNSKYLGDDVSTNVLRFAETKTKEGMNTESYTCEWLFSQRLSANNCEGAAQQARVRWEIEDLFNTLKCRGANLRHDFSRNPHSCFNWHSLSFFAFGIFELFRFSETVKQRGDWPQSTLAEKLLGQLLHRPTEEIFSKGTLSKKIQFRYHFVVELVLSRETHRENAVEVLKTG